MSLKRLKRFDFAATKHYIYNNYIEASDQHTEKLTKVLYLESNPCLNSYPPTHGAASPAKAKDPR